MHQKASLLAGLAVLFVALGVTVVVSSRAPGSGHRTVGYGTARPGTAGHGAAADTSAAPMLRLRPGPTSTVRPDGRRRRPTVLVQPRSVTVAAGRLVGFTAAASGQPAPRPQWQRSVNGGRTWTNIPGARRITYTFTAKRSESGTEYRAVFRNAAGRATTRAARLTVGVARTLRSGGSGAGGSGASGGVGGSGGSGAHGGAGSSAPPTIIVQPADQSVQSGNPATFITGATGVVTSTQWEISTDGGVDWSDIPGATSQTYAIIATADENGYEYRAVLSNSAGSATTRAATLTVNAPPSPSAPQVTTQPANQTVLSGDYATFTAAASGNPTPEAQWEVSSDGGQS